VTAAQGGRYGLLERHNGQAGQWERQRVPPSLREVRSLYPDHAAWFAKYKAAVDHLVDTEVIHPGDAADMYARAETAALPT
jgi:hypothetical protein